MLHWVIVALRFEWKRTSELLCVKVILIVILNNRLQIGLLHRIWIHFIFSFTGWPSIKGNPNFQSHAGKECTFEEWVASLKIYKRPWPLRHLIQRQWIIVNLILWTMFNIVSWCSTSSLCCGKFSTAKLKRGRRAAHCKWLMIKDWHRVQNFKVYHLRCKLSHGCEK